MKDEEIKDNNVIALAVGDDTEILNLELRQVTAGTLSLCSMANLGILDAKSNDDIDIFDVLAFMYIHANPLPEVRKLILPKGEKDEKNRPLAFVSGVLDWADKNMPMKDIGDYMDKMSEMMEQAFQGAVEPITDASEEVSKKKE